MTTRPRFRPGLAAALLLFAVGLPVRAAAPAAAPTPFTATYQVLRDGARIGEATITLRRDGDDGHFTYRNRLKGTAGLAALLGASSDEATRFRWHDGAPETVRYDYAMAMAVKQKQRHLQVDWQARRVTVDEGKGSSSYAAAPGMVDRNTLPLALGLALQAGATEVELPVGVRQRVEPQRYAVSGRETVQVPAGRFDAERVERTDTDKPFEAWYAPAQFPLPVKLAQSEGGNLTLLLVRFQSL